MKHITASNNTGLRNAYTDEPEPHPNLFAGSLQLFFWFFFHAAAWRSYVARLDPGLRPDFCLAELKTRQWRNPNLRRLLFQGYVIWPLLISLILGLSGIASRSILFSGAPLGLGRGVLFSFALSVTLGLIGGVAGSTAFGLVSGVISSAAFILASSLPDEEARLVALVTALGMASGLGGSIAFGVASPRPGSRASTTPAYSPVRQASGIVFGIVIGIIGSVVVSSLVSSVALNAAFDITSRHLNEIASELTLGSSFNLARAVVFGLAGGLAAGTATAWRVNRRRSLSVGFGLGLVIGLVRLVSTTQVTPELVGLANAALLATLFVLSYVLADRIAGPWAGAVAGALASGGVFFLAIIGSHTRWPILPLGVLYILLGLTLTWWRPVLFYPMLTAWHLLLYRADERRQAGQTSLLRWHAAFWDDYQRLRLAGLDEHLLLVIERNPAEGQAALNYLATGNQRWAAQVVQIELDARRLENCTVVETIGQAHRSLAAGELEGPASALLRSFSRISQDVEAARQQESAYNRRLAFSAVEERLDGLLRELTRSSEPYAVRFRPIATGWRQAIAAHRRALTVAAEQRQEIDSPYVIGVPLTAQQEIFVGRTDISARIEQILAQGQRSPLLLYGQRRMGKTSLLNNLGRLLPSTITPLFVDLQGPASQASSHSGLLYNIARDMVRSAGQSRGLALPSLSREALVDDPFTAFDEWLDEVERLIQPGLALLTLDEFEALDSALTRGRFDETSVLGMLRHLIQHRTFFKVLLAGSHTLAEIQRWAGYLINVQVVHTGYLKEAETRQLVERPVLDFALRYEPEASRRVLALTRGHPFLVQLLCAEIVALKNEQAPAVRRLAHPADVEEAAREALASGSFFFADIQNNQVDAAGLAILRFLANRGEGIASSRETLARHVPVASLYDTLARLIQRELIEPADEGYRFQVELIRRWFAGHEFK